MTVAAFQSFARSLDPDISLSEPRSFDMLFADDEMTARVTLAPDDATIVTDIFVHDASLHHGGVRRALVHALLAVNGAAAANSDFVVGLDSRSFVVLTGRSSLGGLDPNTFSQALVFWLGQARRLKDCARSLAFEGGDHALELENAN